MGVTQWRKVWSKKPRSCKKVVVCYLGWGQGLDMAVIEFENIRVWTAETLSQFKHGASFAKGKYKRARISKKMKGLLQLACKFGTQWNNRTIDQRVKEWEKNYLLVTTPKLQRDMQAEAAVLVKKAMVAETRARRGMCREGKHCKRQQARRKVN